MKRIVLAVVLLLLFSPAMAAETNPDTSTEAAKVEMCNLLAVIGDQAMGLRMQGVSLETVLTVILKQMAGSGMNPDAALTVLALVKKTYEVPKGTDMKKFVMDSCDKADQSNQ